MEKTSDYIPITMPKFIDPEGVILARAQAIWERFGVRWEQQRNQAALKVVGVSPRLQELAAERGMDKALYDARLTILKGVRDDDPEKGLLVRNQVLAEFSSQVSSLPWQIYNPKRAVDALSAKYQRRPELLSDLTDCISDLTPERQKLLRLLIEAEKYGFVGYENLFGQLKSTEPFIMLTYSCLRRERDDLGKPVKRLYGGIWESKFFDLWRTRGLKRFFERLVGAGVWGQVELKVLLPDKEPWEVWGWSEEGRDEQERIIDRLQAEGTKILEKKLGSNACVLRYSKYFTRQAEVLANMRGLKIPDSFIEEEKEFYATMDIPESELAGVSVSSIRNYAAEGLEFLEKPPITIIGIESPIRQRDSVYQLARWDNPQPIIHPIKFSGEVIG